MGVKLIVCDMDGVLIQPRSSWRAIYGALNVDTSDIYADFRNNKIDDETFLNREVERLREKGIKKRDIIRAINSIEVMEGFENFMRYIVKYRSAIVSAGFDMVADKITSGHICHILANGIIFDGEVPLKGVIRVPFRGKDKVIEELIEKFKPDSIAVIGDSRYDAVMFDYADISIAFNPCDEVVKAKADFVVKKADLNELINILERHL